MKTSFCWLRRGAWLFGVVTLVSLSASAQLTYTLNTTDRGWYDDTGAHNPANDNYIIGLLDGTQYRSFFVFDRSPVVGTVTAAELRFFLPVDGFNSPGATENLFIYMVNTTPVSTLVVGGAGLTSIYSDLGGGTSFGSATVGDSTEGAFVSIALNAAFLTYINSVPGQFGVGGRVTTLSGGLDQNVFAFSATDDVADGNTRLVLTIDAPAATPVPEPSTYGFFGSGLLMAAVVLRRRQGRTGPAR